MDEALAQRLSDPASLCAPASVSVLYEPEYEQLQAEIARLVSPDATGVH